MPEDLAGSGHTLGRERADVAWFVGDVVTGFPDEECRQGDSDDRESDAEIQRLRPKPYRAAIEPVASALAATAT
jgi:hypothetical protein